MRTLTAALAACILQASPAFAQEDFSAAKQMMAKAPGEAAKEAAAKGNTQLLSVPRCDNVVPSLGGNLEGTKRPSKPAWKSCASILGSDTVNRLKSLEVWVSKYNSAMLNLSKEKVTTQ